MFDVDKFVKKVSEIGTSISREASRYAPAILSSDKKFANAFAASVAVLVCADKQVETDETIQALNFIQNDPRLKESSLVVYAIDSYSKIIESLSKEFTNEPEFLVQKAKIIQENIPGLNTDHKEYIKSLCNHLAGPTADNEEIMVRNEIIAAI